MSAEYNFSNETILKLYKQLLLLRHSEETIAKLYPEQEMRTPTHLGTGQEAVAVGVCEALSASDVAYSHHRCHNHYLAKGGSLLGLFAELYGKVTGCSLGKGGSVHLTARDQGFIASSAILSQTIATAVGSALAFKMDESKNIAVTFFGDAAVEEGCFYESLNYASTHSLPVLFICENNLYSTESSLNVRQPSGTELCDRARSFKINSFKIDGNNVFEVYVKSIEAAKYIRSQSRPVFIECMTYRFREHVGPNYDFDVNREYRSKEEQEYWMNEKCPIKYAKRYIKDNNIASIQELSDIENKVIEDVLFAATKAKESPWPETSSLLENVI